MSFTIFDIIATNASKKCDFTKLRKRFMNLNNLFYESPSLIYFLIEFYRNG